MKIIKTAIFCLAVVTGVSSVLAKPARRDVMTVKQPDGTSLQIRLFGDEYMHFVTTVDGKLLHQDDQGLYTYAYVDDEGSLLSTGVSASVFSPTVNTVDIKNLDLQKIALQRNVEKRRAQTIPSPLRSAGNKSRAPQSGYGLVSSTYPQTGSPKGLIILVEYTDVSFKVNNPKAFFDDLINGENFTQYGATGSALQYFTDQSHGKFKPGFDVYGPVKLGKDRAYYGRNDRYGEDMNPHLMVTESIEALASTVNFKDYDTDGDGVIDNVYIFYAGESESDGGDATSVWPHSWDVRDAGIYKTVDGVLIGHYACSNEWDINYNRPDGIGTFVHEFSHVMGLPDLYHTTAFADYTPDEYSVMDYGCYCNQSRTPPYYSAYERNALSWEEPLILTGADNIVLNPIDKGGFALIATEKDTEFFLLENRQKTGWDTYLPGHGLLIWHIDYVPSVFAQNVVNNTKSHQYVDIVEANNKPSSSPSSNRAGWTFPGTSNIAEFTSSTTPALKSWSGKSIDLPITEITEKDGIITFKVAGGMPDFETPVPSADVVNGERAFTATWAPVDGANDYLLTVYAVGAGEDGKFSTGFDGQSLPEGWTASAIDWYASSSNYGLSAPSYKFGTDAQTLTTSEFGGDITKLTFWSKGQGSTNSTLDIEGLQDDKWVNITNYSPINGRVDNAEIDFPAGVKRIRFIYRKKSGNLAIDDVEIQFTGGDKLLPDYKEKSTGGAVSFKVDKLLDTTDEYYFTVKAVNGAQSSKTSQPVYVNLNSDAGVGDIIADENDIPVEYFNLQGMRVVTPQPGMVVIRRQGKNVSKLIIR